MATPIEEIPRSTRGQPITGLSPTGQGDFRLTLGSGQEIRVPATDPDVATFQAFQQKQRGQIQQVAESGGRAGVFMATPQGILNTVTGKIVEAPQATPTAPVPPAPSPSPLPAPASPVSVTTPVTPVPETTEVAPPVARAADIQDLYDPTVLAEIRTAESNIDTMAARLSAGLAAGGATQIVGELFKKFGVEEELSLVSAYNAQILDTQQRLRDIPEDIQTTLQDIGVTEAQLNRLIVKESQKPLEVLERLMAQKGAAQDRIQQSLQFVGLFADAALQDQAAKIEAMKFDLEFEQGKLAGLKEDQRFMLTLALDERTDRLNFANSLIEAGAPKSITDAALAADSVEEMQAIAAPYFASVAEQERARDLAPGIARQIVDMEDEQALEFIRGQARQFGVDVNELINAIEAVRPEEKEEKLDTRVVETDGKKLLIDTQTGETIKELGIALDTQVVEASGRKKLIDKQTGETIKDLGAADIEESKGEVISIKEAQDLNLPLSLVGSNEEEILGDINSPIPPAWFRQMIEEQLQQSVASDVLQVEWETFRIRVKKSGEEDLLSFEDL